MKKIILVLVVLLIAWVQNRPENMPAAQLDRYDKARLVEKRVHVGGHVGKKNA